MVLDIALSFNDVADMLNTSNNPDHVITAEHKLLECIQVSTKGLNGAQKKVLSECKVLYGRLIEWKDPETALESYKESLALHESYEACLHLARLNWKLQTADMKVIEALLRRAVISLPEGEEEEEAEIILARLLFQDSRRKYEAMELLNKLEFDFSVCHRIACLDLQSFPPVGDESPDCPVHIWDSIFESDMLQFMQSLFASDALFWSEHKYNSPGTGYFSYEMPLDSVPVSLLEIAIHKLWQCACKSDSRATKSRFVEVWAHSRPHSNGHPLHFDYVVENDGITPRHPILSSIAFLDASCGGPTLVTDQTRTCEITTKGWLIPPKENRFACFDGRLLHAVLPGVGFTENPLSKRLTFMAAFWEKDPHAPLLESEAESSWAEDFIKKGVFENSTDLAVDSTGESVLYVVDVWERVKGNNKKSKLEGIDLLDEECFSCFTPLDSGIVTATSGECSLNCGGKCECCRMKNSS